MYSPRPPIQGPGVQKGWNEQPLFISCFSYHIFQLSSSLFDLSIPAIEDHGHPTQVRHLGICHHQRFNIEPTSSQDSRKSAQHARFVLYQTVENVPRGRAIHGGRRVVKNVRHRIFHCRFAHGRGWTKSTLSEMLFKRQG